MKPLLLQAKKGNLSLDKRHSTDSTKEPFAPSSVRLNQAPIFSSLCEPIELHEDAGGMPPGDS